MTGTTLTYRELRNQATALGATLERYTPDGGPPLTAVFAHQSSTAFAGVLATLLRGHGYVPLNPAFPPLRTRVMLERAGCRALIVDRESSEQLAEVLGGLAGPLLVLLPEHDDVRSFRERWPQHVWVCAGELEPAEAFQPATPDPDAMAYLLFTSGSTGTPKGVMVAQRNVRHFVDVMVERYDITEQDRFSQTFDLTFDLSAFDMFVAWERGACLCRPSRKTLLNPGRFIQESQLTMWFSVPSVGVFMKRLGMLKPDMYPTLRWSLFCGEPLPAEIAGMWAQAAPKSIIENLYGPTELTIACAVYRWDATNSPAECHLGVVPIGRPYPGMEAIVVNDSLQEVAPGEEGELLMTGPQRSLGYWRDAAKTAAAFVHVPGRAEMFYRTGDRVRRPLGADPLVYLGRLDHQVKIQGYRVELGEVEAHLRQEANVEVAVALAWPVTSGGAVGIVAFVGGDTTLSLEELRTRLRAKLPGYAVPREIRVLPQLPLNANGKVDRNALLKLLENSA